MKSRLVLASVVLSIVLVLALAATGVHAQSAPPTKTPAPEPPTKTPVPAPTEPPPTQVPPTSVPPTEPPPTQVPPTQPPPTEVPSTQIPPTEVPPTQAPTNPPPTQPAPTVTSTPPATATPTPRVPVTATPSQTPTTTSTASRTPTSTRSPNPSPSASPKVSPSPSPSASPGHTSTPTSRPTTTRLPAIQEESTSTPTPAPTNTPIATSSGFELPSPPLLAGIGILLLIAIVVVADRWAARRRQRPVYFSVEGANPGAAAVVADSMRVPDPSPTPDKVRRSDPSLVAVAEPVTTDDPVPALDPSLTPDREPAPDPGLVAVVDSFAAPDPAAGDADPRLVPVIASAPDPSATSRKKKDDRAITRDLTGKLLGRYRVIERVDVGGMAVVYRGQHVDLERHVAIKVLGQPFLAADLDDLARRFKREAKTIATLRHPNIVQIFDYGVEGDVHYLVMEFVEGTNLQAAMKLRKIARRPWRPQELVDLATQIGAALDYAHGQGVVHRDIKPANILISTNGLPILTDFGLSAIRKTRTTLISTLGQPFGTPEYISPEQAMDYSSANAQSDVYSFGCVLYEMITGHLVFEADTPLSLALMHISSDPIPPSAYVPDLPPAVEQVILMALEKDPADRFQSAGELAAALREAWEENRQPIPRQAGQALDLDRNDTTERDPGATTAGDNTADPGPDAAAARPRSILHRLVDPRPDADAGQVADGEPDPDRGLAEGESARIQSDLLPGIELSEEEARFILKAIEQNGGQVSRAYVQEELGLSAYHARELVDEWTESGLLIKSTKPQQPSTVSTKLATLARKRLGLPKGEAA